jgi:hypothetical protein
MDQLDLSFDVYYRVYVDGGTGSDLNPGTDTAPKATIAQGITVAETEYTPGNAASVLVAQGIYSGTGPVATMVEGVSLYGGYASGNWAVRDTTLYTSYIVDASTSGGTEADPNRAVYFGSGITDVTVLDSFNITTGLGSRNAGIFCYQSSPTISNNAISGHSSGVVESNERFYGISNSSASPVIVGNTILGSYNDSGMSYGIYNLSSAGTIERNWIYGGDGTGQSTAIYNTTGSSPDIFNNVILGGDGDFGSFGINNNSSSPAIYNNTIDGGTGSVEGGFCIRLQTSSSDIRNNILFFDSVNLSGVGIDERTTSTSNPAAVRNNNFYNFHPNGSIYDDENGTDVDDLDTTAVSTGEGSATLDTWGNVIEDPDFDTDFSLNATASAGDNVLYGGEDLSAVFTDDKDGTARTIESSGQTNGGDGWSMGAYEY